MDWGWVHREPSTQQHGDAARGWADGQPAADDAGANRQPETGVQRSHRGSRRYNAAPSPTVIWRHRNEPILWTTTRRNCARLFPFVCSCAQRQELDENTLSGQSLAWAWDFWARWGILRFLPLVARWLREARPITAPNPTSASTGDPSNNVPASTSNVMALLPEHFAVRNTGNGVAALARQVSARSPLSSWLPIRPSCRPPLAFHP